MFLSVPCNVVLLAFFLTSTPLLLDLAFTLDINDVMAEVGSWFREINGLLLGFSKLKFSIKISQVKDNEINLYFIFNQYTIVSYIFQLVNKVKRAKMNNNHSL